MMTSHSLCQRVPPAEGGGAPGALGAVLPASLLVLVMRVAYGATFVWRIVKGILLVAQRRQRMIEGPTALPRAP